MRIFPFRATYLRLFPSSFPFPCLVPMMYVNAGGLMPTSTHLPTSLPAANESEPGWHEDAASHYELLMRSIRERPWPVGLLPSATAAFISCKQTQILYMFKHAETFCYIYIHTSKLNLPFFYLQRQFIYIPHSKTKINIF